MGGGGWVAGLGGGGWVVELAIIMAPLIEKVSQGFEVVGVAGQVQGGDEGRAASIFARYFTS